MTPHLLEECSTKLIECGFFVVVGKALPPRDPDSDEDDEDDEDEDEEDRTDEPAVVREPDED
jgi:hypothetical protein